MTRETPHRAGPQARSAHERERGSLPSIQHRGRQEAGECADAREGILPVRGSLGSVWWAGLGFVLRVEEGVRPKAEGEKKPSDVAVQDREGQKRHF